MLDQSAIPEGSQKQPVTLQNGKTTGEESAAQITAFEDTWQWSQEAEAVYREIVERGPRKLADLMQALHRQPPTANIGKLLYDIRAIVAPRL